MTLQEPLAHIPRVVPHWLALWAASIAGGACLLRRRASGTGQAQSRLILLLVAESKQRPVTYLERLQ